MSIFFSESFIFGAYITTFPVVSMTLYISIWFLYFCQGGKIKKKLDLLDSYIKPLNVPHWWRSQLQIQYVLSNIKLLTSKFIDLVSQLGAHLFKSTFLMFMWTSTTIKLPTSNEILSVLSNDPSINSICFYSQFFLSHIYRHTYTRIYI